MRRLAGIALAAMVVLIGLAGLSAGVGSAQTKALYGVGFSPLVFFNVPGVPNQGPFPPPIPQSQLNALIDAVAPASQWIRTYQSRAYSTCYFPGNPGCPGAPNDIAPYARSKGLSVMLTAYLSYPPTSDPNYQADRAFQQQVNETEIRYALQAAASGNVEIISVGSEALEQNLTPQEALAFLQQVKAAIQQNNYRGPSGQLVRVTQCDITGNVWNLAGYSDLMYDLVDVVCYHTYPWFGTSISGATTALDTDWNYISQWAVRKPTRKPILIGETGWPDAPNGATPVCCSQGVANGDNAALYLQTFRTWAAAKTSQGLLGYFYFEAFNEPWKAPSGTPAQRTEANFGLWTAQASNIVPNQSWTTTATLKPAFQTLVGSSGIGQTGPTPTPVIPEPSPLWLFATGLLPVLLKLCRFRRRERR